MPSMDQTKALAQELVDYISGEPKRFEEAEAAKNKNKEAQANARKAALVDDVAKKIAAATASDDDSGGNKHETSAKK